MKGTIITFGSKAATIQTENKQQFYAPFEELSNILMGNLSNELIPLNVTFKIDKKRYSGHVFSIPRYYALNVEVKDILFL
tara:strand:+ start:507 stop:746 length:240 start_codon:yes stop_codon:yes gene_type:complete